MGGVTTYNYTNQSPVSQVDTNGLSPATTVLVIGGVVVTIYGVSVFIDTINEAVNALKKDREAQIRVHENIDALVAGEKVPYPNAEIELQQARGELLQKTMDIIANAPPGTSITGPASNPLNPIEASGILLQNGIKVIGEKSTSGVEACKK